VCGGRFAICVGLKCDDLCTPEGWTLEVRDERGQTLTGATVGTDIWPGTQGLYGAELELVAPETEGVFGWWVTAPAVAAPASNEAHSATGHAECMARFDVRTVTDAGLRLTVTVVDRDRQEPVAGARVVVHPYRAVTNELGVAELELPRGPYRVFVTGGGFLPLRLDGELTDVDAIRAELVADLGPSDAELWA
jgi:hypothetical protein